MAAVASLLHDQSVSISRPCADSEEDLLPLRSFTCFKTLLLSLAARALLSMCVNCSKGGMDWLSSTQTISHLSQSFLAAHERASFKTRSTEVFFIAVNLKIIESSSNFKAYISFGIYFQKKKNMRRTFLPSLPQGTATEGTSSTVNRTRVMTMSCHSFGI